MVYDNPLIAFIIGGTAGIFAFAISNAISVWQKRYSLAQQYQDSAKSAKPILFKLILIIVSALIITFSLHSVVPHTLLVQEGVLVGKDLFSVRSVSGYIAEYTHNLSDVNEGDDLVVFRRNPDPREIAQASLRRDILQEKIRFERLRQPSADSFIGAKFESLDRRWDMLNEREKQLIRQKDFDLQNNKQYTSLTTGSYQRVKKELSAISHRLKQQQAELKIVETEMKSAAKMVEKGLIPRLDKERRVESYNVALSKYNELKERERLLREEMAQIETAVLRSGKSKDHLLDNINVWLQDLRLEKQQVESERDKLNDILENEKEHANERHLSRIRQLQFELAELNALLSNYKSHKTITVKAPWSGRIGYRDPSPTNPKPSGAPIAILYKPGNVWAQIRVSESQANKLVENMTIEVSNPVSSPHQAQFFGQIKDRITLQDGSVELRIVCDPSAALLRELADGKEASLQVKINSNGMGFNEIVGKLSSPDLQTVFWLGLTAFILIALFVTLYKDHRAKRTSKSSSAPAPHSNIRPISIYSSGDTTTPFEKQRNRNFPPLPDTDWEYVYDFIENSATVEEELPTLRAAATSNQGRG